MQLFISVESLHLWLSQPFCARFLSHAFYRVPCYIHVAWQKMISVSSQNLHSNYDFYMMFYWFYLSLTSGDFGTHKKRPKLLRLGVEILIGSLLFLYNHMFILLFTEFGTVCGETGCLEICFLNCLLILLVKITKVSTIPFMPSDSS